LRFKAGEEEEVQGEEEEKKEPRGNKKKQRKNEKRKERKNTQAKCVCVWSSFSQLLIRFGEAKGKVQEMERRKEEKKEKLRRS
jgi:hypothetical protein